MILALGNIDMNALIDGALLMANDENMTHELNSEKGQGTWTHYDGWGIAFINGDGEWHTYKSTTSIHKDPYLNTLRSINTKHAIIHMRKKMGSEVAHENTHPFVANGFGTQKQLFCHNGFIDEEISHSPRFTPRGKTDSEKLFYSLLTQLQNSANIVDAIRTNFDSYNKLTGTNVILANKTQSIVAIRKNSFPKYYQMHMAHCEGSVVISSEKLPNIEANWDALDQGDVVVLDNNTTTCVIHKEMQKEVVLSN